MVPFIYETVTKLPGDRVHYTKMRFFNYNSYTTYDNVYLYKDKKVFWIQDTDKTVKWDDIR